MKKLLNQKAAFVFNIQLFCVQLLSKLSIIIHTQILNLWCKIDAFYISQRGISQ